LWLAGTIENPFVAGKPWIQLHPFIRNTIVNYDEKWNLDPPPSFHGFRDDLPLTVYIRNLPHWRQHGATYFITFRLADSIPRDYLEYITRLRADWFARNPPPQSKEAFEELSKLLSERMEYWLDQGMGSCVLQEECISQIVHESLQHFHGVRYELGASVIMANHVHSIIRPLETASLELEYMLGSCKEFTAKRINRIFGQSGAVWQEESYDRIIRDAEHLWRCLQYIGKNPSKAGRTRESCHLWVNPDWMKLGWRFDG
jgi:REP element-mobilizing transposase RayT